MNHSQLFIRIAISAIALCATCCLAAPKADVEDIKIIKINDNNYESEILKSKKPVLLDITSTS
ncbi:MAG: hypothetical protein HUK20_07770, partial [Fibrobacter sp.]|nr:hypothetical protein [Fibrobacter sp.]